MQLVFEFGSDAVQPIIEAIRRVLGGLPYSIKCLPATHDTDRTMIDTLESAETKLLRGEISGFSLDPQRGDIRYALVLKPNFEGGPLSIYLGTIEYTGQDYDRIWNLLLAIPGLHVVCLGFEEGVELADTELTVDAFPWNKWPLVLGALRDQSGSGSWTIREGPEMKRLKISGSGGSSNRLPTPST